MSRRFVLGTCGCGWVLTLLGVLVGIMQLEAGAADRREEFVSKERKDQNQKSHDTPASDPEQAARDAQIDAFNRKLRPHIGKEFTVTGVLRRGKLGWLIPYDGSGVYVYGDPKGMNGLNRFADKRVTVTGTLHYKPLWLPPPGPIVAGIPEHYYFDVNECRIVAAP